MKVIKNANIVTETGILWDGAMVIDDGKIVAVGQMKESDFPENAEVIDAEGTYVGPGFVDIHVHGGNGFSTCFETEKAARFFLAHGTTSLLATLDYTFAFEKFLKAIREIKAAIESGNAPNVKGIYAEGPYLNPDYGAYSDLNPWRHPICKEEYQPLVDEAGDYVKVWAIAPEREDIKDFVDYAKTVNPAVRFSVGHSEALPEEINALGKRKPTIQTHFGCATGQIPVALGTRAIGPDEYCLGDPDMYAEMICDSCGIHVRPFMQQLLLKIKGVHRVILITDSTPESYETPEGMEEVLDLNFDHKGGLSGSRLTMDLACRNIMTHTNCGIAQAFLMASTNPAKALGMDDTIGSLAPGKRADIVFVDDRFNVKSVMLGGDVCLF